MTATYRRKWSVELPDSLLSRFFFDLETMLRLAPQWDVKSLRLDQPIQPGARFELDVEYDREEADVSFSGSLEEFSPGSDFRIKLQAPCRTVDFSITIQTLSSNKLISFEIHSNPAPTVYDIREYDMWARSILNYLKISASSSFFKKAWKWFIDGYWLKMTQSGKRIVFFVIVSEGFSFVLLLAVLLWWKFFN